MIEILIALLILSFGLLGMAGLQARALKGNQSSMQRTQAVMMSYYILDAMRVDSNNVKLLNYNTGSDPLCNVAALSGTTLPINNLKHWIQSLKSTIGNATDTSTCGEVLCDADGICEIKVRWDDTRAGGLGAQIITTNTKL